MPFLDVALQRYDSPVAFFAGVFVALFALPFYSLSRSKAAVEPYRSHPVIGTALWAAAFIFAAGALRLLYFGVRLYL